jgi:hypothetical protein
MKDRLVVKAPWAAPADRPAESNLAVGRLPGLAVTKGHDMERAIAAAVHDVRLSLHIMQRRAEAEIMQFRKDRRRP